MFVYNIRAAPNILCCSHSTSQGKIKSLEQIYLFSMPVKEYQIVEHFLGPSLKDEVMKIMPVQKQTRAGQRTRFKVQLGFEAWRHACADHAGRKACSTPLMCQGRSVIIHCLPRSVAHPFHRISGLRLRW
jgi:hypothetical protein